MSNLYQNEMLKKILIEFKELFKNSNYNLDLTKKERLKKINSNFVEVDQDYSKSILSEYIDRLNVESKLSIFFDKMNLSTDIVMSKSNIKIFFNTNVMEDKFLSSLDEGKIQDFYNWYDNNVNKTDWYLYIIKATKKVFDEELLNEDFDIKCWVDISFTLMALFEIKNSYKRVMEDLLPIQEFLLNNFKIMPIYDFLNLVEKNCSSVWFESDGIDVIYTPLCIQYFDFLEKLINEPNDYKEREVASGFKRENVEQYYDGNKVKNKDEISKYMQSKVLEKFIVCDKNSFSIEHSMLKMFDKYSFFQNNFRGYFNLIKEINIIDKIRISSEKETNQGIKRVIRWDFKENITEDKRKYFSENFNFILNDIILNLDKLTLNEKEIEQRFKSSVRELNLLLKMQDSGENNNIRVKKAKL